MRRCNQQARVFFNAIYVYYSNCAQYWSSVFARNWIFYAFHLFLWFLSKKSAKSVVLKQHHLFSVCKFYWHWNLPFRSTRNLIQTKLGLKKMTRWWLWWFRKKKNFFRQYIYSKAIQLTSRTHSNHMILWFVTSIVTP